ncbi:FCD domain-containing protein [Cognatishimia sp. SS12]|uniref:GntR family transcriptional regulator n=1 Tax=Cognatishimia sp. SS12 TaxID=2979465 RepID=UPI00232C764B|nr:FCD domain-containing protein [Cognatishimia sp. SS12]MDC0739600.1 FCD domain-containing protein [Cognatishimia sp. SS12]
MNDLAPNSDSTQTDTELAYGSIRDDIIQGHLQPGSKLKVADLRARYSVGAAPLREALSRLVGDRLVVQQTQRGFRVKEASPADVEDVGRVRNLLECEALRESLLSGKDDWEARVVASYHRLTLAEGRSKSPENLRELELRNNEFHEALVSATQSRWLLELRAQVYHHHERYRYLSRTKKNSSRDTAAEHAAIYDAVIRRDVKEACALTTDHIDRTTKSASEAMSS